MSGAVLRSSRRPTLVRQEQTIDAVERVETWLDHGETGYGGTIPTDDLRTLLSLARSNGWQDIATAPKDGTRVIVWGRDYKAPCSAEFHSIREWCVMGPPLKQQPTHWQPLPEPPVATPRTKAGDK